MQWHAWCLDAQTEGCGVAPQHSKDWWLAAALSTSIPVIYSFSGGMRASIMTDATQVSPTPTACAK